MAKTKSDIAAVIPEHFGAEEFTTREAKDVQDIARGNQKRSAAGKRKGAVNVQRTAKIKRGHSGSAAQAVSAQQPLRENFPVDFKPASDLQAPPVPKGMAFRWIRFRVGDKPDAKNLSKKLRMGWRPYPAKDAPANYLAPETTQTQYGEAICSGDLLLCYMPAELLAKRNSFFRRKLQERSKGVQDQVKSETGGAVIVEENKSRVSRGARRPQFQEDAG